MKGKANGRRFRGPVARVVGLAFLLFAGLTVAGCGLGPGEDKGEAALWVTRDYGARVLAEESGFAVNESSNAMRMLDETAELETAYGGEYVEAVDGLSGGSEAGRRFDWFYSVNGVVAERGSAQFRVVGGDIVWWDYRDWTDAMEVGAVVGSYPAPFSTGYEDRDWGVEIDCRGAPGPCRVVERELADDGIELEDTGENIIVRVGTWDRVSGTPEGRRISHGPAASGVFVRFDAGSTGTPAGEQPSPWRLVGLDQQGEDELDYGPEAGLVAALRRGEAPPVWLITGGTEEAVRMAATALGREYLKRRYAAVVSDGQVSSLPLP